MKLEDLEPLIERKGQTLDITRPCWNSNKLEFWVRLEGCSYALSELLERQYGRQHHLVEKPQVRIAYNCLTQCWDGELVPEAFELSDEDCLATDWVTI